MSRDEFMRQLERLLEDVAEEEKREALSFYRSYFEDAGVENEAQILKELESPEKVAAIIKAGTGMDGAAGTGEYTERGFEDSRFEQKHPVDIRKNTKEQQSGSGPSGQEYAGYEDRNEYDYENASFDSGKSSSNIGDGRSTYGGRSTAEILLIVVLAIVTSPIWIGIVGGVAGGIFGLAVSVVCIAGSFYIAGGALVGVGIGQIITGSMAIGFAMTGVGLLLLAVAILATVLCVWVCGKVIPWLCRLVGNVWNRIFSGRERRA